MIFMKKDALPPASIVYTGVPVEETIINTFYYNKEEIYHNQKPKSETGYTKYLKINGFSKAEEIKNILVSHNIDVMVIEDVFNVDQRSKIEIIEDSIFIVLKTLNYDEGFPVYNYFSLILTGETVISVNEKHSSVLETIVTRLKQANGLVRSEGSGYLLYAIMDVLMDTNINSSKMIEEYLTLTEEQALDDTLTNKNEIYSWRKDINHLKNLILPFLDYSIVRNLLSNNSFKQEHEKYLIDLLDHVQRLNEKLIGFKETLRIIYEIQMNNISLSMNKTMQTLTIFSAIFIPLSFLAGVFGMNFIEMPLLSSSYGFIVFISLCIISMILMILYFKRKKFF